MQQKRGRFYSGGRGRRIKIVTAFIALLILVAIAAIPPVLPLDRGGGCVITEATPCLAGKWIEKNHTPEVGAVGEAVVGTGDYIFIVWCRYYSTTPEFWRYDPSTDNWNDSMNVSGLPIGAFRNGAALAWDHGDYIYALLGGRYKDSNRTLFYRYCISNNTWLRLTDTPHAQCAGDAITWANSSIYAILGSRKHKTVFARYNCSNSSWSVLSLPDNWKNETDDGASLVWTGGTYLYALQGEVGEDENQPITSFSRYNITNNSSGTWEDMHPIPEIEGVGDGGSLLWIGNWLNEYSDYIFALGGGSGVEGEAPGYNFYAYNISNNSWENLTSIPCPIGKWVGNRLGFANGHIYYWQGAPAKPPEKWICGGDAFFMFDIDTAPTGSISVTSSPSGAGISFDGIPINAIAPYTITDVEPGYHTIELSLDGYEDWSTSVQVTAGETSYVNATLTISLPEAIKDYIANMYCGGTTAFDCVLDFNEDCALNKLKTPLPSGYTHDAICTAEVIDWAYDNIGYTPPEEGAPPEAIKKYLAEVCGDGSVTEAGCDKVGMACMLEVEPPSPIPSGYSSADLCKADVYNWCYLNIGWRPPEEEIVINEIEANPPGKDAGNEWVELYNPASEDVDLTSWTLKTTHGRIGKVTCSGIIDANGYRVFESSIQWLDNEGDSVILRDKGGAKIDEVAFTDTKNDDRTRQRCPNGIDTDSYSDWEFRPSTKGYSNKCS